MNPHRKIRVLVVDDSALARSSIKNSLLRDPAINVVGVAADAYEAREKIIALEPQVITLDLEMPRLDGLSFLKILREHHPVPVIIISSFTPEGSARALEALEAGAFEVISKADTFDRAESGQRLCDLVKAAGESKPFVQRALPTPERAAGAADSRHFDGRRILAVGSSTGGVEALRELLPQLPPNVPPILVAQHIPSNFSRLMAEKLDALCPFEVREARDGEVLHPGQCLLAPGNYHVLALPAGAGYKVRLTQSPPVHHCRPSVDVLFRSVADCAGANAVGVLLTGMGADGAMGMQQLRAVGAHTIAQDEKSCVVYGMPRAAVKLGAVVEVLPLSTMPRAILKALGQPRPA